MNYLIMIYLNEEEKVILGFYFYYIFANGFYSNFDLFNIIISFHH